MTWTLFRQTLHQRRTALLWYSIGLITYSVFIAWYFPLMEQMNIQQYIEAFPPEIIELFAGSSVSLATFGGFIATEYTGLVWILIMAAAGITFATKSLSGEVNAGTMELLLAQPVPRRSLVVTRWFALVAYLSVLVLSTSVPLYVTAVWRDIEVDAGHIALFSAVALLLSLAIASVAYALAAWASDSGKPAGIVGGLLALMWLLAFLASSVRWAEELNVVNLFHYWNSATILDKGVVDASTWWVYGIVSLAGLAAAVFIFSRRDVSA